MSDKIRKYQGATFKVGPIGEKNLFSRDEEFSNLDEAIAYKEELQQFGSQRVVINEVVIDKNGEFVGWRKFEKKI